MLHEIRQAMEREAAQRQEALLEDLESVRLMSIAHYVILLLGALSSFALLFITSVRASNGSRWSAELGLSLAFIIVLLTEILRGLPRSLTWTARFLRSASERLNSRLHQDYLAPYWWASAVLVWAPAICFGVGAANRPGPWIAAGSPEHAAKQAALIQAITLVAGLLAIQITLFTFVLGRLLDKYSGRIAAVVAGHKAILAVVLFELGMLASLQIMLFQGYPAAYASLSWMAEVQSVICLALSIIITLRGTNPQGAVSYAGLSFARYVKRSVKQPTAADRTWRRAVWVCLGTLGLDWRDVRRLSSLAPSPAATTKTAELLSSLLNVAYKAIQEEDDETLDTALRSVYVVAEAYVAARRQYVIMGDQVFRFLNNRMGILMNLASSKANESLITIILGHMGSFGRLSLQIGSLQGNKTPEGDVPRDHELVLYWVGLLRTGFQSGFTLQHSTAASEAVRQVQMIGITALKEGYTEACRFTCISALQQMHELCFGKSDYYRHTLAAECLRSVMKIWLAAVASARYRSLNVGVGEAAAAATEMMVDRHMQLGATVVPMLTELSAVLVCKLDDQEVILQDIFFTCMRKERSLIWEEHACGQALISIIQMLVRFAEKAVETKQLVPEAYVDALYEVGYCVVKGVPDFQPGTRHGIHEALFAAWLSMVSLYVKNKPMQFEWLRSMFSLLGYSIVIGLKRQDHDLMGSLRKAMEGYLQLLKQTEDGPDLLRDDCWSYLQLAGAWLYRVPDHSNLSLEILDALSGSRRDKRSSSYLSFGSEWESLGYPTTMFGDFRLTRLMQVQHWISESERKEFDLVENELISGSYLVEYAELMQEKDENQ